MKKNLIVQFLKEKNKNVYDAIVDEYATIILGWPINLLKRVIEVDLERQTGEAVRLNYFSLCKAVKKFKKKRPVLEKKPSSTPRANSKYEFKDAHELETESTTPGSFTIK
ncbi:MAG: hypothetical protein JSS79_18135 [Bacteroidetes bacterium]|nr:hypothetical protein [Bacteroidota bacterium]